MHIHRVLLDLFMVNVAVGIVVGLVAEQGGLRAHTTRTLLDHLVLDRTVLELQRVHLRIAQVTV